LPTSGHHHHQVFTMKYLAPLSLSVVLACSVAGCSRPADTTPPISPDAGVGSGTNDATNKGNSTGSGATKDNGMSGNPGTTGATAGNGGTQGNSGQGTGVGPPSASAASR
jgi:hypothetical protein